jgi:hypothetical protein
MRVCNWSLIEATLCLSPEFGRATLVMFLFSALPTIYLITRLLRIGTAGRASCRNVTGDATSPCRLSAQTQGFYRLAIATDDEKNRGPTLNCERRSRRRALTRRWKSIPAMHGWMVPDTIPFNEVQAERGRRARCSRRSSGVPM